MDKISAQTPFIKKYFYFALRNTFFTLNNLKGFLIGNIYLPGYKSVD